MFPTFVMRSIVPCVLGRAFVYCNCCPKKKKNVCVYPHHGHSAFIAGLLPECVLVLWLFFLQTQFHDGKDASMTLPPGIDVLQWCHSPSPGSKGINYFSHPYSFPAEAIWLWLVCFNTGGNLAFRSCDKPAGLHCLFCSCVEAPSAFWPQDHREPVWSVVGQCFWQSITASHFIHLI